MDAKPELKGSLAAFGWLAFAAAFIFTGLANLPSPYGNGFGIAYAGGVWTIPAGGTIFSMGFLFSGLALLLAGFVNFWKGHPYHGTIFGTYGFFWLAFSTTNVVANNGYSLAAFAFVFLLISITFLLSSFKHGWGSTFIFLLTVIAFALWIAEFWNIAPATTKAHSLSSGLSWAVGVEFILTGLVAWYGATADLTNLSWGRKVLPM